MVAFRAVLFDMDGVVIDTRQSIMDFWHAVAAEQGVLLTTDDFDRNIHGVPPAHTLKALFPDLPPVPDAAFLDRITRYELGLRYTEIAGVTLLLQSLKAAGVHTALVTSGMGWKVDEVVRQLALEGLFDVIVTAADIQRGKPDLAVISPPPRSCRSLRPTASCSRMRSVASDPPSQPAWSASVSRPGIWPTC